MQNTFGPHLQNLMITSQNSSPAVPRSITGCFVTQNIGEVARSDGGISSKKILVKIIYLMKKIGSFLLPTFSFVEKKQRQSTSHLMCAASQNARRVLRF
ncbi:unknown [Bacteroides sp. CAG:20]|nr:unknown [Bacteroides sp. CAG:20]